MVIQYIRHMTAGLAALLLYGATALAQNVEVDGHLDSNSIPIGGAMHLHIRVQHLRDVTVTWPHLGGALEGLEVVQKTDSSVTTQGGSVIESASFAITGFDAGTYYIPPLQFSYRSAQDTAVRTVFTQALPLTIRDVHVDTAQGLRDIKPPLRVPITFMEVLPYIAGAVGIIALILLIYYVMKKRTLGQSILPEVPARPAHTVALEALRSLDSEKLWQRGRIKEYYSQLTDIVRVYIERRFDVMAMELTTDEILDGLKQPLGTDPSRNLLKDVLERADLVKFAKYQPGQNEHESSMAEATEFVMTTSGTNVSHTTADMNSGVIS